MYKVFYNDKTILLSEVPVLSSKVFQFGSACIFDQALDLLKNTSTKQVNIYYHNLEKLWNAFKNHFDYLEAAGGLVKNQKGEILFIHRLGRWDLPKGKVEEGETTEVAAVREVEEECGINHLILNKLITKTYHIYFQEKLKLKATYWYAMDYNGDEVLVPQTEEGIAKVEWKNQAETQAVMHETYDNIRIVLETQIP